MIRVTVDVRVMVRVSNLLGSDYSQEENLPNRIEPLKKISI